MEILIENLCILHAKGAPLLVNVCASTILTVDMSTNNNVGSTQVAYCTTIFCIGIPPSLCIKVKVHEQPKIIWHEWDKHKGLFFENPLQYLWKTGWKGLKPLPHQQYHQGTKVHTVQTQFMCVLSSNNYVCNFYR